MSDKRFEFYSDDMVIGVLDTVIGRTFNSFEIVDCLNEQQDTINDLNGEFEESSAFIIEQRKEIQTLKEENRKLKKAEKINMEYAEQIVEENHKLRIAKNDLRREKEQLQKENEQLQKELDNFKPVMFQGMRGGAVILYSKNPIMMTK